MPTAGDYEIEFVMHHREPDGEHQESIWYGSGCVCTVRLDDIAVDIYVDGKDRLLDNKTGQFIYSALDMPEDIQNDRQLSDAIASERLDQRNNSWFDIYHNGEHLDMVSHEFDDAFDQACEYLIAEFTNLCQVENNQVPQVEGRRVVVLDLDD